tara:strand:- start:343 stop:489 length:147 start_codon:yes stop_codon:yes gene_type:complete
MIATKTTLKLLSKSGMSNVISEFIKTADRLEISIAAIFLYFVLVIFSP